MSSEEEGAGDENQGETPFDRIETEFNSFSNPLSASSLLKSEPTNPTLVNDLLPPRYFQDGISPSPSFPDDSSSSIALPGDFSPSPDLLDDLVPSRYFQDGSASSIALPDDLSSSPDLIGSVAITTKFTPNIEPSANPLDNLQTTLATDTLTRRLVDDLQTTSNPLSGFGISTSYIDELNSTPTTLHDHLTTLHTLNHSSIASSFSTKTSAVNSSSAFTETTEAANPTETPEIASEIDSFVTKARFQFAYERTFESLEAYGDKISISILSFVGAELLRSSSLFVTGQPKVAASLIGSALAIHAFVNSNDNQETKSE